MSPTKGTKPMKKSTITLSSILTLRLPGMPPSISPQVLMTMRAKRRSTASPTLFVLISYRGGYLW